MNRAGTNQSAGPLAPSTTLCPGRTVSSPEIQTEQLSTQEYNVHNAGLGLPSWFSGKESSYQCRAIGDMNLIPGLGRSLGEGIFSKKIKRNGNALQCSCLENSIDREA